MADVKIQLFSGTQAGYDKATKVEGGLYVITDTKRIYRGSDLVASKDVEVVSTMPAVADAITGMLYVHTYTDTETNKVITELKTANSGKTEYITIATSEAARVTPDNELTFYNKSINASDNNITGLTVGNFDPGVVVTTIDNTYNSETGESSGASDEKLATEKAIATALKDTIVNVEYTAPAGESGPVLLFTSKNGIQKSINIPRDNFLSAAVLNNETKELELTMVTDDVIKIPVADLMVSELDTDHIILTEDIQVQGSNWGSWTNGSTMEAGTTLTQILTKGVATQIPPTYTKPTIAIANNSGTAANTNLEAGTSLDVKLKSTFTQKNGGALTAHQFYKNNTAVGTSSTTTPVTYDESVVLGDETITYTSKASYAQGPVLNDNLGDPYPTGQIAAGTITSSNYQFTGKRYGFFGASATQFSMTSDDIRKLSKTGLYSGTSNANTTFTINIPVGAQYVLIAYPTTWGALGTVKYEETNDSGMASNFTKEDNVQVADARGGSNGLMEYNVYTYKMDTPAAAAMTFTVTV